MEELLELIREYVLMKQQLRACKLPAYQITMSYRDCESMVVNTQSTIDTIQAVMAKHHMGMCRHHLMKMKSYGVNIELEMAELEMLV